MMSVCLPINCETTESISQEEDPGVLISDAELDSPPQAPNGQCCRPKGTSLRAPRKPEREGDSSGRRQAWLVRAATSDRGVAPRRELC
ncbi:unnamed protein product, partial [Iphiclides podalirius]